MKQLLAFGCLALSIAACAPQSTTSSASSTTPTFDGFYENPVMTAESSGCPDLGRIPYLAISNNLALLQTQTLQFQGRVTPEGQAVHGFQFESADVRGSNRSSLRAECYDIRSKLHL